MKNKLLIHQKSHNGIMYKCNICDKEVSSTNATNGIIMQWKRAVSKDIKNQFIRVSSTNAMNVITKPLKKVISKRIKNQFMSNEGVKTQRELVHKTSKKKCNNQSKRQ